MAFIENARRTFLRNACAEILGIKPNGVPTMSDGNSNVSVEIGRELIAELVRGGFKPRAGITLKGQQVGAEFDRLVGAFLRTGFIRGMRALRPGRFRLAHGVHIRNTAQYRHLELLRLIGEDPSVQLSSVARQQFQAVTASDYQVRADVVVLRRPEAKPLTAQGKPLRKPNSIDAAATPLLKRTGTEALLLHANVSCKWTFRSDRAQNIRTEAIALMRHRKGPMPHMVVVTAEPMPSRLRSIAIGTGEVDCVYHVALSELEQALKRSYAAANRMRTKQARVARQRALDDQISALELMTTGDRLRDISDLPFDLAI
jgi:hypothetical protein